MSLIISVRLLRFTIHFLISGLWFELHPKILCRKWKYLRTPQLYRLMMIRFMFLAEKIPTSNIFTYFRYSSDKGFILQINQIKEKRKGAAKVNGEIWNVSVGKRNMLTFFGSYSPSNVIVHFNSIYLLRVKYGQALSI